VLWIRHYGSGKLEKNVFSVGQIKPHHFAEISRAVFVVKRYL
jgi:hypothetical protein